jgi:orotate phosphoribosyltransferase-like protein
VKRAVAWRQEGLTRAEIAERLGRSVAGVTAQMCRQGIRRKRESVVFSDWMREEARLAREALAWELAVARSERATSPLLRSWPQGTWP